MENLLKEVFSVSFPQDNPFFQVLVYKDQEQICGFLCYDKMYEQLEIEYLYVDPAYRRKKIASQLLEFMIQEAQMMELLLCLWKSMNIIKSHKNFILNMDLKKAQSEKNTMEVKMVF